MNFIKRAFSEIGVLCLTIGVCSIVSATRNSMLRDCSEYMSEESEKS